jgi:hypothetical protein
MPAHNHNNIPRPTVVSGGNFGSGGYDNDGGGANTGGGGSHPNMHPWIAFNAIIKT